MTGRPLSAQRDTTPLAGSPPWLNMGEIKARLPPLAMTWRSGFEPRKASGFEVDLPNALDIEKAVIGIRPEDLDDHRLKGWPQIDMKVEVVEMLGSDQLIYGAVGADGLIARVDPNLKVRPGDRVRLGVNAQRMHVFDAETQLAVV